MTSLLLLLALPASANEFWVVQEGDPCPAPTFCDSSIINGLETIGFSGAGPHTLYVGPGTWDTTIWLGALYSGLTVESLEGPTLTTLTFSYGSVEDILTLGADTTGVTLRGFTVEAQDRAIRIGEGASLALDDVHITDASGGPVALDGRGALLEAGAALTVAHSAFVGLDAGSAAGGAIYANGGASIALNDVRFEHNAAVIGGAIYAQSTPLSGAAVNLSDNRTGAGAGYGADGNGGAIAVLSGTAQLSDSTLSGNAAAREGGGLYASHSVVELRRTTLSGGGASDGAGVALAGGQLTLDQCVLIDNTALGDGGGVHAVGANPVEISDSRFGGNEAHTGGAVNLAGDSAYAFAAQLTGNVFEGNLADTRSALAVVSYGDLTFRQNLVCDNEALNQQTIGASGSGTARRWENNLFLRNHADVYSGLYLSGSYTDTLSHNTFLLQSAGALLLDGASAQMENNVFAWTGAGYGVELSGLATYTPVGASVWLENLPAHRSDGSPAAPPDHALPDGSPLIYEDPSTMPCGWYTAFPGGPLDGNDALSYGSSQHNPGPTLLLGATGGDHAPSALWTDGDLDGAYPAYDCDDSDAQVSPDDAEVIGDGLDNDCDPSTSDTDPDADGDGFPASADCDDANPLIYPGAPERCDGVDDDCDGLPEAESACACDLFGYGVHSYAFCQATVQWSSAREACGALGMDLLVMDDAAEAVWAGFIVDGASETWCGANDLDADGVFTWAGAPLNSWFGWAGEEPNNAGGSEYCVAFYGNGLLNDQTCTRLNPFVCEQTCQDLDGDGYLDETCGGDDCDDGDDTVSPGADEQWYDGVDQDCDGASDFDQDGDGYARDADGGDDCDDEDPAISPEGAEVPYDGTDQDCDGDDLLDQDGDGHDADFAGGDDCDDQDPATHPGVDEAWYDGVDQDCDGASDLDQDGDGHDADFAGGDDCDDDDPLAYPGAA
ncbi:MAG: right-handed parallel beta-helix repeat-containing protein, partial [Deltaproteobacteria bacterium]|nr:right-handed parallel beta-helix repeat-containing protein [Deltaproteobacteria bacterium]